MVDYILSILIPTKNRKKYLLKCIEEVLSSCSEKVQIVVQDNSDERLSLNDLERFSDQNFNYYYEAGDISFVDNFSRALEKASGEYICFIGDDDGILPEIENVAIWMQKNNIDALSQNISATYFWPNNQHVVKNSETGLLKIFYANNNVYVKFTKDELKKLFKAGGQGYMEFGLARPYHGVVRKKIFDNIKADTGSYINGLSPDIYASVAISSRIDKVYVINFPITISGISPKSGGAASANGTHTGRLKNAPHFRGHDRYCWDKLVPPIYSVETIWADSALHAARDLQMDDIEDNFGRDYLFHICRKKYPNFVEEYLEYQQEYKYKPHKFISEYINNDVFYLIYRIKRKVLKRKSDNILRTNIKDICEAKDQIREYLTHNHYKIEKTLLNICAMEGWKYEKKLN
jgi:Glycosyltransferases involved in cell wall biogenesis